MEDRIYNILFCGTGGQGVLTAAEVCCWAAVYEGFHVKKSEVHGMAQRGGSVESHVRFGKTVFSPLIPAGQVDILVAFDPGERERMKSFLKSGGHDLFPAFEDGKKKIDNVKFLNVFLLGALSKFLPLSEDHWMQALERTFKTKNFEDNRKAFQRGRGEDL